MLNAIPILGWLLSFLFSASASVPFYFLWNYVCPKYLPFVPAPYNRIPFWDCVWIFMLVPILKAVFIPTLASVTQTNKDK